MELSEEQKQAIAEWVADGLSLTDIQNRLQADFNINRTYIDVRFLVDDLNLAIKDKEVPDPPNPDSSSAASLSAEDDIGGGAVTVEMDKITAPGAVVSGTVIFPDGEKAQWMIDPTGRPGLMPAREGYKPSAEDIKAFQEKLGALLQSQGF